MKAQAENKTDRYQASDNAALPPDVRKGWALPQDAPALSGAAPQSLDTLIIANELGLIIPNLETIGFARLLSR